MEKLNIKEFLDQDEKKDLLRLLTAGSVEIDPDRSFAFR